MPVAASSSQYAATVRIPVSALARIIDSFGAWARSSSFVNPRSTTGSPRIASNEAQIGTDPPSRLYSGATPNVRSIARAAARVAGCSIGVSDGRLILIDEVLTPDSSRFWPADQYAPGRGQPSFDKQFVRDYLETLAWNKTPPGPVLPPDVVARTSAKYLEAYERLTGQLL